MVSPFERNCSKETLGGHVWGRRRGEVATFVALPDPCGFEGWPGSIDSGVSIPGARLEQCPRPDTRCSLTYSHPLLDPAAIPNIA